MSALRLAASLLATAAAVTLAATPAHAVEFVVQNLVSDGFVPAQIIDPSLINPWGMSFSPTSPM
jgi:hypothetical protein